MWREFLYGRRLLKQEIPPNYHRYLHRKRVICTKALSFITCEEFQCLRCGAKHETIMNQMISGNKVCCYCPTCLALGNVNEAVHFYHLPEPTVKTQPVELVWSGQLSNNQQKVAKELVTLYKQKKSVLVHAVTGAGKTEMIFQVIHFAVNQGMRIAIASPRVDVCLELYPRIQAVFPTLKISLLYGTQTEEYFYSRLVICTTHQLLRFYQAFDLLIVDEVDAFPFRGNKMLDYGVKQALKKSGSLIYLTATPTKELNQQVLRNEIHKEQVSVRFHGHPLPVPQAIWCNRYAEKIGNNRLPPILYKILMKQKNKQRRTLIFCPSIQLMEKLTALIEKFFPNNSVSSASSAEEDRYQRVQQMREEVYDFFVVTTILERGVTFSDIDVLVIGSNHAVFNQASLIQIAGRVGRKAEFPKGAVYFLHDGWSSAMRNALRQIREMNKDV